MHDHDLATLGRLVDRLSELEQISVSAPDRPIVEIARASLLDAIAAVSHCVRDGDYFALPAREGASSGLCLHHGWPATPPDLRT